MKFLWFWLSWAVSITFHLSSYNLFSAKVLLISSDDYNYYKVAVASGTRLLEGVVPDTCKEAGMDAVCGGDASCQFTSNLCMDTPLSSGCSIHTLLQPITEQICNVTNPRKCQELERLFVYANDWSVGDAGVLGGSYPAQGKNVVAGDNDTFAYCVVCGSCEGKIKYLFFSSITFICDSNLYPSVWIFLYF